MFEKQDKALFLVIIFSTLFSIWLMFSTFKVSDGELLIDTKLWGDFQSHIPLIRSFSYGENIPPEYPLYSNEQIRYHFLFYMIVGFLEKIGISIDLALNTLSAFGMTGMLSGIYLLGKKITHSRLASVLAVVFTILNSSFSWIYYFFIGGNRVTEFGEIYRITDWGGFGPYKDTVLSAFWTLNIYTNQRHLAFAFMLVIFAVLFIYYSKSKVSLIAGILIIALLPWFHKAAFSILIGILVALIFSISQSRKRLILTLVVGIALSIPGIIYLNNPDGGEGAFRIAFGFLYNSTSWSEIPLENNFLRWIVYWIINIGILPIGAFLGWVFMQKPNLKFKNFFDKLHFSFFNNQSIWFLIAAALFIVTNIVAFSVEVGANHKLINFSIIIFNIFAGFAISKLLKNYFLIPVGFAFFFILILGGVLDIFPILNDREYSIEDQKNNNLAQWVINETPKDSSFFNTTYDYSNVVYNGRKIFYGWDYFNWSLGYDVESRKEIIQATINGRLEKSDVCEYLEGNSLDYILVNESDPEFVETTVDINYFRENFIQEFGSGNFAVYSVSDSCD